MSKRKKDEGKTALHWLIEGFTLSDLGKHEEAIKCYDKAIEIDPENETALNNKIELLEKLKPQIDVYLSQRVFKLNYWTRLNISIINKETSPVKDVNLEFSKEVEVKGLKEFDLDAGEEKELEIFLKTNDLGEVPVEVKTNYKDAKGRKYVSTKIFVLSVGEIERKIRGEEDKT